MSLGQEKPVTENKISQRVLSTRRCFIYITTNASVKSLEQILPFSLIIQYKYTSRI
jgi:hypothetical protein